MSLVQDAFEEAERREIIKKIIEEKMEEGIGKAVEKMINTWDQQQYWDDLCSQNWGDTVGEESRKTWYYKASQFFPKYMSGKGLDIGYSGYLKDVNPILPDAIGVDKNYPGYDGIVLPFESNSQDYVYSSHTLEHIDDPYSAVIEWFRVVKSGGHMIIVVPHQWLYEKKKFRPSRFNEDHKVFFTSGNFVTMIEESLPINSFRIRHLKENDEGHDYTQAPEEHSKGQYEIEIVLQKL